MKTPPIALAFLIASMVGAANAAPIVTDDFDDGVIDASIWSVSGNTGSTPPATATEAGDDITLDAGQTTSGYHVQAYTDPLTDLNFFNNTITINIDITDLTGSPGSGQNRLWVGIGQAPNNGSNLFNFFPSASMSGVVVMVERIYFDNQERIRTIIYSRVGGSVKVSQVAEFQRPGDEIDLPDSLAITIDSDSVSVVPTGATYFGATPELVTASHGLTSTDLSEFRLAFGVYNNGAVNELTTASIDHIDAQVVPEPSALGLGAAGLLFFARSKAR